MSVSVCVRVCIYAYVCVGFLFSPFTPLLHFHPLPLPPLFLPFFCFVFVLFCLFLSSFFVCLFVCFLGVVCLFVLSLLPALQVA